MPLQQRNQTKIGDSKFVLQSRYYVQYKYTSKKYERIDNSSIP